MLLCVQILKYLTANTEAARFAVDFLLYVRRLKHWCTGSVGNLQHADLDSVSKLGETMRCELLKLLNSRP